MHLCNIPKERPSVDREMNRCLCWVWGACALYEHGFIWIFSLEMNQHLHLVRLEFLLAVVNDGKCASRSAPWRRYSPTSIAGIPINEDPVLSSLDWSSYITKAVDPAHRHWYAVAIDKLYTASK